CGSQAAWADTGTSARDGRNTGAASDARTGRPAVPEPRPGRPAPRRTASWDAPAHAGGSGQRDRRPAHTVRSEGYRGLSSHTDIGTLPCCPIKLPRRPAAFGITHLGEVRGHLVTAAAGLRADLSTAVTAGVIADSIAGIDPAAVRAALHAADRVGVAQACPAPWHPVEYATNLPTTVKERVRAALTDLLTRAGAAQAELDRRLADERDAATAARAGAGDPT